MQLTLQLIIVTVDSVEDFTVNDTTVLVPLEIRPADPMVSQHHKEIFGKMLTSSANVRIIGELGEGKRI